jgi:multidrug efflux system membrane fusion protein
VRVRTSVVQPVERRIVIQGRTEPARVVTLRAEVDGRIVALGAARGARVRHGELIARIDMRDRSR